MKLEVGNVVTLDTMAGVYKAKVTEVKVGGTKREPMEFYTVKPLSTHTDIGKALVAEQYIREDFAHKIVKETV